MTKQPQNTKRLSPTVASKLTSKAGDHLEFRVARLFIFMGFYVRRSREVHTVAHLDRATDLDVMAIRYNAPFRQELQICECKSGGEGPLDRVFWLSGLKSYTNATTATLVRRSTKWNIKDFASEVGIEILDLPRLEELERSLSIPEGAWPGSSDQTFFDTHSREWDAVLAREKDLKQLSQTLVGEVRFHEPFSGINYLLYQLRFLTRQLRDGRIESPSLGRFLVCECVTQLGLFLMKVSEMCVTLPSSDREGLLRKGLTYGSVDPKLADRLMRNARQLTGQMVAHFTGKNIEIDENLFAFPTPPESSQVQAIINRFVERPQITSTLVPLVDLLITERYLKGREATEWINAIFKLSDMRERLALVTDYFRFLEDVEALPPSFLKGRRLSVEGTNDPQSRVQEELFVSPVQQPLSS